MDKALVVFFSMSQTFGIESAHLHTLVPRRMPVRYLVVIDSAGSMIARLFLDTREMVSEMNAAVEEVTSMTAGLIPVIGATSPEWDSVLAGHSDADRADARIYPLKMDCRGVTSTQGHQHSRSNQSVLTRLT